MVIYLDENGDVRSVPSSVPQGTVQRSVVVIVPKSTETRVLKILPPTQKHIPDILCIPCTPSNLDVDGNVVCTASIPAEVTAYAGKAEYQILSVNSEGESILSKRGSFNVTRGVPSDMPDTVEELEKGSVSEIYSLLVDVQGYYNNLLQNIDRVDDLEGLAGVEKLRTVKQTLTGAINELMLITGNDKGFPLDYGMSEKSVKTTDSSVAGLKGFYWSSIDCTNKKITLTSKNGTFGSGAAFNISDYWAVNDIITIHSGSKYTNCSVIKGISGNTITVDKLPFTKATKESGHVTDQAVFVLDKPSNGLCDFGQYSFSVGDDNQSINYAAFSAGRGNKSIGQYGATFGRDNTSEYCALTAGRDNNNLGNASMMCGNNNTNTADAPGSVVGGKLNNNYGDHSIVGGRTNNNYGEQAVVGGKTNTNRGAQAIAGGLDNTNNSGGAYSILGGSSNENNAQSSLVVGNNNANTDEEAPVGGNLIGGYNNTNDGGHGNIIVGHDNTISGYYHNTIVAGRDNGISAHDSIIVGRYNNVVPTGGLVHLRSTIVGGQYNEVNHSYTIVSGQHNKTAALNQALFGRYSKATEDTLLAVGDGSESAPKNAFEISSTGVAKIYEKKLATEDYVDDKVKISGANNALAFVSYEQLVEELLSYPKDKLEIGQSIYIATLGVPDVWIFKKYDDFVHYTYKDERAFGDVVGAGYVIQVGYYGIAALETQKVDLTDYAKTSYVDTLVSDKVTELNVKLSDKADIRSSEDDSMLTFLDVGGTSVSDENLDWLNHVTTAATPITLAVRDYGGRINVATPSEDKHATNKNYVDTLVSSTVDTINSQLASKVSLTTSDTGIAINIGNTLLSEVDLQNLLLLVNNSFYGKWTFKDTIVMDKPKVTQDADIEIFMDFVSNGTEYIGIYVSCNADGIVGMSYSTCMFGEEGLDPDTEVYDTRYGWSNTAYKTIDLGVKGTSLEGIEANFIKLNANRTT